MMQKRKCPKCKKRKDFYKNKARSSGFDSWCKDCMSRYHHGYYKENPDKQKERRRKYVLKYPTYMRDYQLKTKYELTEELFQKILKFQNNCCAICKGLIPGGRWHVWQVDHDHVTNSVRGLLCFNCNKHLGYFERISKSINDYLQDPPAQIVLKRIG